MAADLYIDFLRQLYEDVTGRNAPARGDWATWYSEFLNTGSDIAREIMEDAVKPDAAIPGAELAARTDYLAGSQQAIPDRRPSEAMIRNAKIMSCYSMVIAAVLLITAWTGSAGLGPAVTPFIILGAVNPLLVLFYLSRHKSDAGKR
jgi:hypothetical protein